MSCCCSRADVGSQVGWCRVRRMIRLAMAMMDEANRGLDEGITVMHEIRSILVVEMWTAYVCYETNGLVNWVAYASSPDRCHLSAIGRGGYGAPAAHDWGSNQLSPIAHAPFEPATSRRHPGPQYAGHRHVGTPGQPPCTGCKDPHPDCSRSGPAPSPWIPAGLPCCPPELAWRLWCPQSFAVGMVVH